MSDRAKPWLSAWSTFYEHPALLGHEANHVACFAGPAGAASARLAAAAPALARALCRLEAVPVSADDVDWGPSDNWHKCLCCYLMPRLHFGHKPGCHLDAALTAAGLSAEDREEVRRG